MQRTLFVDVRVIDGSGADPFSAHVLVEGNRIQSVDRDRKLRPALDAQVLVS